MNAKRLRKHLGSQAPLIGGWLRQKALRKLQRLAEKGDIEAREELCSLVIDYDHPIARIIAVNTQCAPREAARRALFYFLTDQWKKYESLDFEHAMLRAAYEAGDEQLRKRIAAKARSMGHVKWVEVLAEGRQGKRLAEVCDHEWEVGVAVLEERRQWDAMWKLAQTGPPEWSKRLIVRLRDVGWSPKEDEEVAAYAELVRLAERIPGKAASLGKLIDCRFALEGHLKPVTRLVFSPNGVLLASGGQDEAARLWRVCDGALIQTLKGHTYGVGDVAFSPDGHMLATLWSGGNGVGLWALPDGAPLKLKGRKKWIDHLAFIPDGRGLVAGAYANELYLWSLPDGTLLKKLEGPPTMVLWLAISPDGGILAAGGRDGRVSFWSLPDGAFRKTLDAGQVLDMTFTPDAMVLVVRDSRSVYLRSIRLQDMAPDPLRFRESPLLEFPDGCRNPFGRLAISPDRTMLAASDVGLNTIWRWVESDDFAVRLWRLADGQLIRVLEGHTGAVGSLAFSPNGQVLVSSAYESRKPDRRKYQHNTVRLWRVSDGALMKILEDQSCPMISPDGGLLATATQASKVCMWQSELTRLSCLPVGQMTLEDLEWAQKALRDKSITEDEQNWLEFVTALVHWRRRAGIIVEGIQRIELGAFDIEI